MTDILSVNNICKSYKQAGDDLKVLDHVSFEIKKSERVALLGPSGVGKSTLLHCVGLLDKIDAGNIKIDDVDISNLNDRKRAKLRGQKLGFVYQYHHLLSDFSALENIMLPQRIIGTSKKQAKERAEMLLETVELSDKARNRPHQLSGGQQQRVAIARALANSPSLLLADEPTGNLDPKTADNVFDQLEKLAKIEEISMLIVTHNEELAKRMDRILQIEDLNG